MAVEENMGNEEAYLDWITENDYKKRTFERTITTRFPPEPNGFLHIGSAYAIHLNYMAAKRYGGHFNLRFDDTNPLREDQAFVDGIIEDMEWLGYSPGSRIYYGSDYFQTIFEAAVTLIKKGSAYVCELNPEEITAGRGTLTESGTESPFRERSVEENLKRFLEMKEGRYPAGSCVLRAKIDMKSSNMNLRDPVLYRIIHASHYRTGREWCIYPMYDFAHPLQDAIEGVTHSLCSIEFKDHRPLYEWVLNELGIEAPPKQREFGRVNMTGVVTSKRFLRELVSEGLVDGWDDPRLPTLKGMRRRGFTPESIRYFIRRLGLVKHQTSVDFSLLEHFVRADLQHTTSSIMAVLNPLKVTITNYEEGKTELLELANNPSNPGLGRREIPFSGVIYIEKEDFMEIPAKGFKRLYLGAEVRLKGAYFIKCQEVVKDEKTGEIIELLCTYDPETKSGSGFSGRKVKGTIHWVSAAHADGVEVHLLDSLLKENAEVPGGNDSLAAKINPDSRMVLKGCKIERGAFGGRVQFMRHGYFCRDKQNSADGEPVFIRTVSLKDTWKRHEGI
ncbi:glutamine--tRNA ligase/YqeY domain fusion protein [Peribacillus sp. SCS-26]|uniref:glutamine--tRNA ligase/YqeY domain fusion protein n=1 Tax=Paraperibacillus marinus TaxID=3115295 RepID=UPI003906872E